MKDCAYYQELISRLLDRELTVEEGEELSEHARSCEQCRAVYTAFSAISGALADGLEEAPEELCENVMAHIRRGELKKQNTRKMKRSRLAAIAACAVLVAGLGVLTVPKLLSGKGAAQSAPAAAPALYAAEPAAAGSGSTLYDAAEAEEAPQEYAEPGVHVSASFAAPASDTTKSENEMIADALERAAEPESSAELVDVSGQGRGKSIAALLVGTPGELPAGQTPDRRFLLRFDVDGVSSQVLLSVYGEKVFYISLSGEQVDMMLADCSWSELRARIYG